MEVLGGETVTAHHRLAKTLEREVVEFYDVSGHARRTVRELKEGVVGSGGFAKCRRCRHASLLRKAEQGPESSSGISCKDNFTNCFRSREGNRYRGSPDRNCGRRKNHRGHGTPLNLRYPKGNARPSGPLAEEHLISQVPVVRYQQTPNPTANRFFFIERNITMAALRQAATCRRPLNGNTCRPTTCFGFWLLLT
jgi:hypothetical protein